MKNTQEHCSQDSDEGTVISYSSVFINAEEREGGRRVDMNEDE